VNVPVPVYGAVPPADVSLTVDDPPLHKIGVADELAVRRVGSVTIADVMAEHPAVLDAVTV
jgi:hypothetical protein